MKRRTEDLKSSIIPGDILYSIRWIEDKGIVECVFVHETLDGSFVVRAEKIDSTQHYVGFGKDTFISLEEAQKAAVVHLRRKALKLKMRAADFEERASKIEKMHLPKKRKDKKQ